MASELQRQLLRRRSVVDVAESFFESEPTPSKTDTKAEMDTSVRRCASPMKSIGKRLSDSFNEERPMHGSIDVVANEPAQKKTDTQGTTMVTSPRVAIFSEKPRNRRNSFVEQMHRRRSITDDSIEKQLLAEEAKAKRLNADCKHPPSCFARMDERGDELHDDSHLRDEKFVPAAVTPPDSPTPLPRSPSGSTTSTPCGMGEQYMPKSQTISDDPLCKVYVGNLPWNATWQSVKKHMSQAGTIAFCKILRYQNGWSRGAGFVIYEEKQAAKDAINMLNGSEFGRPINVDIWTDSWSDERPKQEHAERTNQQQDKKGTRSTDASLRVWVGNLQWQTQWPDLKEHMSVAGEVTYAEVMTFGGIPQRLGGISRGMGFADYESKEGALNAASMLNNVELQGRPLRIDRWTGPLRTTPPPRSFIPFTIFPPR